LGPKMIEETAEQVELIRQRLKTVQSRQKSSADKHRRDIQFEVGERAFLRVSPIRGVIPFGKRGKLHPQFIGPFEVLERVGEVAYRLALPLELSSVHNLFHVSMLRKYVCDPDHVILHTDVQINPDFFPSLGDPRIVDEWVQGLEMIFEVMDCPDHYRVICAQIQLTGDARLWWNAHWSMRPGKKEGCTWDQFKELIRGKYYPSYYRADMERQFLALRQGTRSVNEYEKEFTRLGSF
ncbi:Unknown protein, partial [Striga hermonthica]